MRSLSELARRYLAFRSDLKQLYARPRTEWNTQDSLQRAQEAMRYEASMRALADEIAETIANATDKPA